MHRALRLLALIVCLVTARSAVAQVTLVQSGEAKAVLVVPADAIPDETIAAEELQAHIAQMSGATLAIVRPGEEAGRTPIRIGRAAPEDLARKLAAATRDASAFVLTVDAQGIAFTGLIDPDYAKQIHAVFQLPVRQRREEIRKLAYTDQGRGTTIAAYELLEQLGVRWYAPGDWGLVMPRRDTVVVEAQDRVHQPVIPARLTSTSVSHDRIWDRRMRQGGPQFPSSHGLPGIGHGREYMKEHPQWGSLNDGERKGRQVCISNPQVIEHVVAATRKFFRDNPSADIIGMGANDGRGFCECDNCRALDGGDFDSLGGYDSMTDRYIWLFNQVLDRIKDEFPDKKIGFYAYSVYNRPPVKQVPNRRIVPAVALITLCRIHGMDNPICPESQYQQRIIRQWGKLVDEVYDRGYWFNLSDPGLPFFMITRIRSEIPLGYQLGIRGWRVEINPSWGSETPSLYIASKLLWNPRADVDAMLEEFYSLFFGPAAAPMRTYIRTLDQRLHSADFHAGGSWDMPLIYDAATRQIAVAALAQANQLATAEPYAARVKAFADCWRYFELFDRMLASRNRHDYADSLAALTELKELQAQLREAKPPFINNKFDEYMTRFYTAPTLEGHARVTGQNHLLAGLGSTWAFQLDPGNIGVDINWWNHQNSGSDWKTIDTSRSWSTQGLRYYKGIAWYKQAINVPAVKDGERVFLWFGGVDEAATVWVNSKLVGASARGTFKPFDLDISAAVRPGQTNTVIVRLANETLNELGTGGIIGPVMIYATTDPNAKPSGGVPDQKVVEDMETIAGQ
jgi:hypothetical protein